VGRRRGRIGIVSSAIDKRHQSSAAAPVRSRRPILIFIAVLIGILLTFYGIRIATDAPFLGKWRIRTTPDKTG
jgi:hypothetical protein